MICPTRVTETMLVGARGFKFSWGLRGYSAQDWTSYHRGKFYVAELDGGPRRIRGGKRKNPR